jgi:hypothetical protein
MELGRRRELDQLALVLADRLRDRVLIYRRIWYQLDPDTHRWIRADARALATRTLIAMSEELPESSWLRTHARNVYGINQILAVAGRALTQEGFPGPTP